VPVPKRGDLSVCDNWRGISLLYMMGKLFVRVINDRLQAVVEDSVVVLVGAVCTSTGGEDH